MSRDRPRGSEPDSGAALGGRPQPEAPPERPATGRRGLPRRAISLLLLHGAAAAGGVVAFRLGLPLAWMIGPMVVTAALTLARDVSAPPRLTRSGGQVVVGTGIGLFLTPAAVQVIAASAVPILLSALLIVLVGCAIGYAQARLARTDLATAVFSCVAGGPAEMASLAVRHGGDGAHAALSQSLRIVLIVFLFPQLLLLQGRQFEPFVRTAGDVQPAWLALLLTTAVLTGLLARRVRLVNPFFLGPMLASGTLTAAGLHLSAVPPQLLAAAQILLGVSLGAMFRRRLFRSGRMLFTSLASTALLLVIAIGIAALWGLVFDLPFDTMMLANAPGSVTEMAITAQAMHLDVSLVAAFHMTRVLVTMLLIPLVWQLMRRLPS